MLIDTLLFTIWNAACWINERRPLGDIELGTRIWGFHDHLFQIVVFWIVAPCSPVGVYQCFGETYWLHLLEVSSVATNQPKGN
jgi:hypothetical protein